MPEEEEDEATGKAVEKASRSKEMEEMPKKRTPKKKTTDGQSPSKQKAASPAQLTRAPISQATKKQAFLPVSAFFQESHQRQPPPPGVPPAEVAPVVVVPPPAAVQRPGPSFPHTPPSRTVQTFQEVDPGLAKKLEGWQAEKEAEYMKKRMRIQIDEAFTTAVREGAFKTEEGRRELTRRYDVLMRRHERREQYRRNVILGKEKYMRQMESRCFNERVALIRESCDDDRPGTFEALMDAYKDEDYFSSDMDTQIDRLTAFAYTGTTGMKHKVPMMSRSGSGSSQSGGKGQLPLVDLTGDTPPEPAVDLDKMLEMREGMAVDASEQEKARVWEGPERPVSDVSTSSKKKKKSKQARSTKRAEEETK